MRPALDAVLSAGEAIEAAAQLRKVADALEREAFGLAGRGPRDPYARQLIVSQYATPWGCITIADGPRARRLREQQVRLTHRQAEVLALIGAGMTSNAIAAELGLSHNTIRAHRSTILHRLDARTSEAAVAAALRRGVIE